MNHVQVMNKLEEILKYEFPDCELGFEEDYDLPERHGEIDAYAIDINAGVAYLFEAKSRDKYHSRKKANYQLHKDVRYMIQEQAPEVFLFKRYYVYGVNGNIRIEHIGGKK